MEKSYKYIINPKSQPQPKLAISKAPALPSVISDYVAGQKVLKGQSVIYNGIIYTAVVDTTATPSDSSRDYKMVGAVDGIGIELNVTASDVKITDAEELIFAAKISYYGADRTNSFAEFLTWTSDAGEVNWSNAVATLTPRKDLTAGVYEVVASLTTYGITHKVIISKNSEKKIERERQDRESAIAEEGSMREKLERDIELYYISKSDADKKITASEAKSKQAWEAYAQAKADLAKEQAIADADGKITAEEQARIDAINNAVRTAKEYAEDQDALLKAQQEAYADGKVTQAEANAIAVANAKAELAETNAKAYADGIVDEEEQARIAAAQKAYEDAVAKAKEMDDNVQIGGRNLAKSYDPKRQKGDYATYLLHSEITEEGYYTISFDVDVVTPPLGGQFTCLFCYRSPYENYSYATYDEGRKRYSVTIKVVKNNNASYTSVPNSLYLYPNNDYYNPATENVGEAIFSNVKVEKGNKATDYTEAPEDVEARYQKLIASVDVEFALSASMTVAPTSGWVTTAPAPQDGKYMWQRTRVSLKDGTEEIKGVTCIAGADGRGIVSITEQYYHSTSMTALQGGSWSNTAPTPEDEKWIWTRTVIKYTIGDDTITNAICVTGHKGKDAQGVRANLMPLDNFRYNSGGFHGAPNSYSNGKLTIAEANVCKNAATGIAAFGSRDKQYIDGTTAGKTLIYSYYVRNNTNVPLIVGDHVYNDVSRLTPVQPGQVSRRYTIRRDGYERFIVGESRINGDTATLTGTVEYYDFKVEQAQDGEELVPSAYIPCVIDMRGTQGTSLIYYGTRSFVSTSSYITVGYGDANWINNLNLPLSSIKAGDTLYLLVTLTDTGQSGILYINVTSVGTTVAGKVVAFIKDGHDGAEGIPGTPGADGRTPYLHIAYATNATGTTGFSTTDSTGKTYIGTYTDFVQADSTNPTSYKWMLINGEKGQDAINFDMGRMLHTDPTFMEGYNGIVKYDSTSPESVTVTRIARPADCPTTSPHALQVHFDVNKVSNAPGIGGFVQFTKSRANAVFVHRFIAKVPDGYKLNWACNSIGVGGSHKWVTPNVGTGRYEEYICVTYCGSSGTFRSFGHMYLTGARATMDVIIAYATMYDMTDAPDYYAKIAEAKQATVDLKAYTDGAFADGIISQSEAKAIATYKQQVNESWTSAFAEYERVYANTLLIGTPKTNLLNAKVSLAGAKDALLSAITSAIADGKATTAEAANVDTKYNAYNSALAAFQKALEDAREAIRKGGYEIIDTRNDNQLPSWYRIHYKKTTVREFKLQAVIGIPEAWRNGGYCTLETTVNYSDKSGGRVTQKAILNNSVELQRVGTADDTAWEPWSNMSAQLSNVDALLQALKSGELEQFPDLKYLTDAFQKYSASVTGILFAKVMALSNSVNSITAYLNGDSTSNIAMLKAGLQNPFTANETEKVSINHDGSGHFDTLHFGSGVLDFIARGSSSKSILRVGEGTMSRTLTEIINGNSVDAYTPATIGNISLDNVNNTHDVPFTVANDGTVVRVKCSLNAFAESLQSVGGGLTPIASASVTAEIVGVKELARAWQNIMMPPDGIGSSVTSGSGQVSHDSSMYLNKGSYILRFSLSGNGNGWAKSNSIHQRWSSNERFNAISEKGVRFYGGPNNLVDFNHDHPDGTCFATVRGGLDVDTLKVATGGLYAAGVITTYGYMDRWVGRKIEVRKVSSGRYKLIHNVGSLQYVVQAMVINSDDWNTFVIKDSETTTSVEIGVMWGSSWRDGAIHFSIFAR